MHDSVLNDIAKNLERTGWMKLHTNTTEDFKELAFSLGTPIPSRTDGNLVDTLQPLEQNEAKTRSMSAVYGKGVLPFHTDLAHVKVPPRLVLLRAKIIEDNYPTHICRLQRLWNNDEAILKLKRAVWFVNGGRGKFYTSIISQFHDFQFIRFDPCCMKPALSSFIESYEFLMNLVVDSGYDEIIWNEGLTIIIDNWKSLHSRSDTSKLTRLRILERILVRV